MWDQVRKTAKPLTPDRKHPAPAKPPAQVQTAPMSAKQPLDRVRHFRVGEAVPNHGIPPSDKSMPHDAPRMDHGTHRKMVRGKLRPEARIDLHGMTLAQAHPALIAFIRTARDRDLRLVLVITGKGKDDDAYDPIPVRRGVLRQQVPHWLTGPPLGALVLEVRPAHRRHGGEGAFYVYLKRRR